MALLLSLFAMDIEVMGSNPIEVPIFFSGLFEFETTTASIISLFKIKFVSFLFFHVIFRCHFFIIILICMHVIYLLLLLLLLFIF